MKNKLLIIGAGGHARSCLEVLILSNKYEILGFIDNEKKKLMDYKFLGSDRDIHKFKNVCDNILLCLGGIKDIKLKWLIFQRAKKLKFKFPKIISPLSFISKSSNIGEGTIIMNQCFINANVKIGKNSIINNKALLEHDVMVGNNTTISPGAIINGGVKIGNNVFIGSGSIIKENVIIKSNSIIGMGTTVLKDVNGGVFYNKK
ncbi:acetyltransferase [Candidatus Pelagibacter sp.]|nr:acetyltransferase [Candidatus Pelagibacter sp.]